MGRKSRGEQRRQRRHRAVHQAGEARLHILQHEHAPPRLVLFRAHVRTENLVGQPDREFFVALLFLGEIAEQPAHADILGLLGGLDVELLGLRVPSSRLPCGWCRAAGSSSARSGAGAGIRDVLAADRRQMRRRNAARRFPAAGDDGRAPPRPSPRTVLPNPGSARRDLPRSSYRCGCLPLRRRSRRPAPRARSDRRNSSRSAPFSQFRMILNCIAAADRRSNSFAGIGKARFGDQTALPVEPGGPRSVRVPGGRKPGVLWTRSNTV